MNKEIKEILDRLEYIVFNEIIDYGEELSLNECKLLDYITNLQQDNEKIGKLWREEEAHCILLQQENERLKEENNNKAMNDYAHAIDESWYRELYDDYKSRCEKAIEYIKKNNFHYMNEYALERFRNDLLNILQNGSEEHG